MTKETWRLLQSGHSIVSSLVDLGLQSHRPFEAMTDEILSINSHFASRVANKQDLTEYLQKELQKAKNEYTKRIQEFL